MKFSNQIKDASVLASLMVLGACAPGGNQNGDLRARNIIGGRVSDASFQKEAGVVGLLIFSEVPQQTPADNDNEPSAAASGDGSRVAAHAQPQEPRVAVSICTGSLLSKRKILTAAHCVMTPNVRVVMAIFATDMENADPRTDGVPVASANVHPDYNRARRPGQPSFEASRSDSDMAILTLAADAPADFKFAVLPTAETGPSVNEKLTLAGYGVTNPIVNRFGLNIITGEIVIVPVESSGSGVLRQVDDIGVLQLTDDKKEVLLSGYEGARGACHGDSGGPAYRKEDDGKYTLLGVTSRGTNPIGNCDRDAVYGSVAGQLDWIREKM